MQLFDINTVRYSTVVATIYTPIHSILVTQKNIYNKTLNGIHFPCCCQNYHMLYTCGIFVNTWKTAPGFQAAHIHIQYRNNASDKTKIYICMQQLATMCGRVVSCNRIYRVQLAPCHYVCSKCYLKIILLLSNFSRCSEREISILCQKYTIKHCTPNTFILAKPTNT